MSQNMRCPVCLSIDPGTSCRPITSQEFDCDVCGSYTADIELAMQAREGVYDKDHWELNKIQRAVLSHRIRLRTDTSSHDQRRPLIESIGPGQPQADGRWFRVTRDLLRRLRSEARQPTPAEQAENAIRFIGDRVSAQGDALQEIPDGFRAAIGATDYDKGLWVVEQLESKDLVEVGVKSMPTRFRFNENTALFVRAFKLVTLTLDGWQEYERTKRGRFAGNYGFVALQFDEPELDKLLDVVKDSISAELGYSLIDMRDVEQAGIIDDIMRIQIRGAAFVLADLTHANLGAYWEAGYAEGLDKPVVYICEESVFEDKGTHFDTNHCTTIPWSSEDPKGFCRRLIATLRRSLELG